MCEHSSIVTNKRPPLHVAHDDIALLKHAMWKVYSPMLAQELSNGPSLLDHCNKMTELKL